jgi:hypothetical protein
VIAARAQFKEYTIIVVLEVYVLGQLRTKIDVMGSWFGLTTKDCACLRQKSDRRRNRFFSIESLW